MFDKTLRCSLARPLSQVLGCGALASNDVHGGSILGSIPRVDDIKLFFQK